MAEKGYLIRALDMIEFDGSKHLPTTIFYPGPGRRLIGHEALARSTPTHSALTDFKVELGNVQQQSKGRRGRQFFTPDGSVKTARDVANDFVHELMAQLRRALHERCIETPVSMLVAEPLVMRSELVAEEWLSTYRRNLTEILKQHPEIGTVSFIPEPFAAYQYYRYGHRHPLVAEKMKNIALVLDFGGGTFDACVIETTKTGDISQTGRHSKPLAAGSVPAGGHLINRLIADALFRKAFKADPEVKKGITEFQNWNVGQRELATLDSKFRTFIRHFHAVTQQAERLKLGLSRSIRDWSLTAPLSEAALGSVPENPFVDEGPTQEVEFRAADLRHVLSECVWKPYLKPKIEAVLKGAQAELAGAPITLVLLSGGSANFGWLRELLKRDMSAPLADVPILQIDDFQEVVAKGLAIESARRFYEEGGEFSGVTYNRLCLVLSPDAAGRYPRPFKPRTKTLPNVHDDPGVLLPSASLLQSLVDTPLQWKVKLETAPKKQLEYFFLRSSLNPNDIENTYNVEENRVYTPPKSGFDSELKVELRVSSDGTARPRFIYKTGQKESDEVSAEGRPFAIDMSPVARGSARAYLGLDFGSSNTAISYVSHDQIEVFQKREAEAGWKDLSDLCDVLPFPMADPLARYLRSGSAGDALDFVESALCLFGYVAYLEYCSQTSDKPGTRIFKNFTQRSAGPLWGLLRECLGRARPTDFVAPLAPLIGEFAEQVNQAIDSLNRIKHHKAPAEGADTLGIVRLLGNLGQRAFARAEFGFFSGVQRRPFHDSYEGRFVCARGTNVYWKALTYSGPASFFMGDAAVVLRGEGRALRLAPLMFWWPCEKHSDLEGGHCYLFDLSDKKGVRYKAAAAYCDLKADGVLKPLAESVGALGREDVACQWITGLAFKSAHRGRHAEMPESEDDE